MEEEVDIVIVSSKDGADIEIEKMLTVTTKPDTVLTTKSVPAVPATTTVDYAAPLRTTSSASSTQEVSQLHQTNLVLQKHCRQFVPQYRQLKNK